MPQGTQRKIIGTKQNLGDIGDLSHSYFNFIRMLQEDSVIPSLNQVKYMIKYFYFILFQNFITSKCVLNLISLFYKKSTHL